LLSLFFSSFFFFFIGKDMANPFENITTSDPVAVQAGATDYNPFAAPAAATGSTKSYSSSQAATAPAQSPFATESSAFGGGSSGGSGADDLARREAALARRIAEVEEKERQLKKREVEIGATGFKPPNWPPCKPILYHDIKEDIPTDLQAMVRAGYICWLAYAFLVILNWFAIMCHYFADIKNQEPSGFIVACFMVLLAPALAFTMSYQSLYKGCATNKASSLLWYVITQFCTVGMIIYFSLGVPNTGAAGLFLILDAAGNSNNFITVLISTTAACWLALLAYALYVVRRVWYYYKFAGGGNQRTEEEVRSALNKQGYKAVVENA